MKSQRRKSVLLEELNKIAMAEPALNRSDESISEDLSSNNRSLEKNVTKLTKNYSGGQGKVICFQPRKKNMKSCMIYPEDPFKSQWDLFIALVLIFTCLVTPYRIALVEKDSFRWIITNNTVDSLFLMDIIIIFNSAYMDEDFNLITNRK